jgi:hypothetical protein
MLRGNRRYTPVQPPHNPAENPSITLAARRGDTACLPGARD